MKSVSDRNSKRRYIALCGLISGFALSGCLSAPKQPKTIYKVTRSAQVPTPVAAAIYVSPPVRTGPRINQYGGEVPEASPSTPVGEGGLGEIR